MTTLEQFVYELIEMYRTEAHNLIYESSTSIKGDNDALEAEVKALQHEARRLLAKYKKEG